MRALVVDAYDSFVYVIAQYLQTLGVETDVRRNDTVTPAVVRNTAPDFVVLGPGPGHPADAGYVELIRETALPTLGICLGHQAIGLAFGGRIERAALLMHGKTSVIHHDGLGLFSGHPSKFHATRYHSLIVNADSVPSELTVSATSAGDGYVMAFRHESRPIESVQFHPESILTERGTALFRNFIETHVGSLWVEEDDEELELD